MQLLEFDDRREVVRVRKHSRWCNTQEQSTASSVNADAQSGLV